MNLDLLMSSVVGRASADEHGELSQRILSGEEEARLKLGVKMAEDEYRHFECEVVAAAPDRRSFCFHHQRITEKSVLLIHGFTACPYEMRELGEVLFKQGYNVIGIRLAGHGTNADDFAKYNRFHWKESAQKGLGIAGLMGEEVIVIGESMGGTIAAWLGATFPQVISRLILCAPCFRIANPFAPLMLSRLFRKLIPKNDMGVRYEWQFDYWYRVIPTSGIAELVKLAAEVRKLGPKITMPIVIFQAENDTIVKPRGAVEFYNTLTSLKPDQKKLYLLKDGHHNLTIDLNPNKAEVFEGILEYIGGYF